MLHQLSVLFLHQSGVQFQEHGREQEVPKMNSPYFLRQKIHQRNFLYPLGPVLTALLVDYTNDNN